MLARIYDPLKDLEAITVRRCYFIRPTNFESIEVHGFADSSTVNFALVEQNRNFRPKGEGRSGRRPLLPKRKLNILVDLTLGKSYHSVVTFLHAQKIKCYTFSIQTSSKLISYYVCPWKVGP